MEASDFIFFYVLAGIVLFYVFLGIWTKWFPATHKIRIHKKMKGVLPYYRAEVKRPIFGWTPFWAFHLSGTISRDAGWLNSKETVMHNIELFKDLKNIKDEKDEKTIY